MICPRCDEESTSFSTSWFNTDVICTECKLEEPSLPGYFHAREVEEAHVLAGDRNFAGVGLGPDDLAMIVKLIAARKAGI